MFVSEWEQWQKDCVWTVRIEKALKMLDKSVGVHSRKDGADGLNIFFGSRLEDDDVWVHTIDEIL